MSLVNSDYHYSFSKISRFLNMIMLSLHVLECHMISLLILLIIRSAHSEYWSYISTILLKTCTHIRLAKKHRAVYFLFKIYQLIFYLFIPFGFSLNWKYLEVLNLSIFNPNLCPRIQLWNNGMFEENKTINMKQKNPS